MQLVRGLHNLRASHRGSVVTIGNFDGVHLGHQEMLRVLRSRAAEVGLPATVVSFEPSPREYLATGPVPPRLSRFREKFAALEQFGVDRFVCLRFDERMQAISPDEFAHGILVNGLGARWVVVGEDFRFAHRRRGDVAMLEILGERYGFSVDTVGPVLLNGERVSSSLVREALMKGDLDRARQMLRRPYSMSGKVVAGQALGRKLGFPTANIRLHRQAAALAGVFAVRVSGAGFDRVPGVANLGTRPVVGGIEVLLETHIFDFDGDLYRRHLHVDFAARLRDELWFPNLGELVEQMKLDAAQARKILADSR